MYSHKRSEETGEFAHGDPMAIKLQNMQKYDGGIIFPPPVQYEFSTKLKQC